MLTDHPQLSSAGDPYFALDARQRAERIMLDTDLKYNFQVYSNVNHGFALRGDMSDPYQRECAMLTTHRG